MAGPDRFSLEVVTPERVMLECEARSASIPAHDGEIGVLRNRAPMVVELGIGKLRVETVETDGTSREELLFIDGGFAEMNSNRLTILTGDAKRPDELDRDAAQTALTAAREMKAIDDAAFEERQRALERARQQLRMTS